MDEATTGSRSDLHPLSELSEAEVWAMVDGSPDGMLLADEAGTMLFVNSQMECLFGYDRGDLLCQSVDVLLPERYRRVHAAHRTRYRAEPATRAMGTGLDLVARRRDGTEFPVEISLSPIRTGDGLRVVATVRDITDRLTADAHAHAVSHTFDAAHDGVFMFEPDTLRFSYVNQGAVVQLGYGADELLAMTPLHIKPEFTEQSFREMLAPLIADQVDSHTFTTVHRRKDGTDIPVEIIVDYPPPAQPGQARLLVALVRDVSDRLRLEKIARTQQVRVEILEDREQLARDLHDLVIQRLFAAGMGLQAIQKFATDTVVQERIIDTIEQLDQTIDELRSAIFHLAAARNGAVTDQVKDRIDQATVALGHEPTLRIAGDLESVAPAVLDEVLPTLSEALSNIARHANATATNIGIDIGDAAVVLTITDDGIGIDPTAPRGNGLTNVETRAEQLGGIASIASNPATGTTLTWTAPRI
ncbi:MAG: PAS domain S-box protein [Acidimicrobiia bacterium]|nr:PAS domain S-box protein [Acidimicrobiia bacterium]